MVTGISLLRKAASVLLRHLQASSVSYAEARFCAQAEFQRLLHPGQRVAATPADAEEFLQSRREGWSRERPPIDWYAGALAAASLCDSLPLSVARDLLTAANYYGDSRLVHDLGARLRPDASLELKYEILKQSGKAYKNDGKFGHARSCYREALLAAHDAGAKGTVAYFLLLYAKLCDHYEQRIAWHRAFHKIAHTRFRRLSHDDCNSDRKELWLRISEDALARAISETEPALAQKYFKAALSRSKVIDDRYVRIASHHYELRLSQLLSIMGPPDIGTLEEIMVAFWQLRDLAYQMENERAINVRRLHYLRAARSIIEAYPASQGVAGLDFLVSILQGEWRVEANDVRNSADKLSDRRTAAMAAFELAQWQQIVVQGETRRGRNTDAIAFMENAMQLLTAGTQELMFDLYYDVVTKLGSLYEAERRWLDAERIYTEAYEYSQRIVQRVREDERALSEHESDGLLLLPELSLLSKSERIRLAQELRHDYRLLLQRALTLCERIQRPQREQILQATRRRIGRGAMQYHEIARHVRALSSDQEPAARVVLAKIAALLRSWHRDDIQEALTRIDVPRHVRLVAKDYPHADTTALDGRSIEIEFDPEVLGVLVAEVLENVSEAAQRDGLVDFHASLDVAVRGAEVYLVVEDDAGDVEVLRQVVESINRGVRPISRRGSEGGYGLFTLRQYMLDAMQISSPWLVEAYATERKALLIPLGQLLSYPQQEPGR